MSERLCSHHFSFMVVKDNAWNNDCYASMVTKQIVYLSVYLSVSIFF